MSVIEKDVALNQLADQANVAQFVSFGPGLIPKVRFARIHRATSVPENDLADSLRLLFEGSPEHTVNIRSFRPEQTKGAEFHYGLGDIQNVASHVKRLTSDGWFVIVNETIDVNDGGVSGVVLGDVIEFAPQDTPRCVEKPGTCRLPRSIGTQLLQTVYGFTPLVDFDSHSRVEFSVHPMRRGFRRDHTIIWEIEQSPVSTVAPSPTWPNKFSQFIGDKVFGLLIAAACGCRIPRATAIARHIAPFTFGERTGTNEFWQRTAPRVQLPGKLPTTFGWRDLFRLYEDMAAEGGAEDCASVLSQEGVDPIFSGAAAFTADGSVVIEGVAGSGVKFMLGAEPPSELPERVLSNVRLVLDQLLAKCGPVRVEWVYDGSQTWILQLHVGMIASDGDVICEGTASQWIDVFVSDGLESLRERILTIGQSGVGIRLIGDVGVTSHFGDLLRNGHVPSVIVRAMEVP